MTDDEALLRGALDNSEDRTARLVLADWLDENGHGEQAEVIRARCALAVLPPDDSNRTSLQWREQALWERHLADWYEHCGLPLDWEQALKVFRWRLAETIAWFGDGEGIRTPVLCPRPLDPLAPSERQGVVNDLAVARARLLARRDAWPSSVADGLSGGRLLVFYPDATLSDGAAEAGSSGFFDTENAPAWDTWVLATEDSRHARDPRSYGSYVVCWVPPAWVAPVDFGIRVNPEECIRWAADVDTLLTRHLRAAGLLA